MGPSEMLPNQSYGHSGHIKSDFSICGYNLPKMVQDEFMSQGYQHRFKMHYSDFPQYPLSIPQVGNDQKFASGNNITSQTLPPLTWHSESQHSPVLSATILQRSDNFCSENISLAMSSPQTFAKVLKSRQQGKKSQETISLEDASTDSDASGNNSLKLECTSRPATPNKAVHPTPPPSGCSSSRTNTPTHSIGHLSTETPLQPTCNQRLFPSNPGLTQQNPMMPPPLNPGMQGTGRVFSPVAMNNHGFYPPSGNHFQIPNFDRSAPVMNPDPVHLGGFSYHLHSPSMNRPPQHSYGIREPHFAEMRHFQPHPRMDNMSNKFESDQEFLRHSYRYNFLQSRLPSSTITYGQMGEFPLHASFENFNNAYEFNCPSNNTYRRLHSDNDADKISERSCLSRHFMPRQAPPALFSRNVLKSQNFKDENNDALTIHAVDPEKNSGVKQGVSFNCYGPIQTCLQVPTPSSQDTCTRNQLQHNKETLRQYEEFDDHSSTQDTNEENKQMSDSLATDESNTSDTLFSYPGSALHIQNECSNLDELACESPHKKLRLEFSPKSILDGLQKFGLNEAFCKLLEMGQEHDRQNFFVDLFSFMEDKQVPIITMPTVSKHPIDLFKLYCIVKKEGGMVEVTKGKKWREVSSALNMGSSSSAGFVLKKNYGKYLFPYECYRDRGNIDPSSILACLEQPLKKAGKRPESLNFENCDIQSLNKSSDNSFPVKVFPSQVVCPLQPAMSQRAVPTQLMHGYGSNFPDNNAFQPFVHGYPKCPKSSNLYDTEHLQLICHPFLPSFPSIKVERRIIGSHIHKELLFPSNSIESIRPRCIRQKRLTFKQIGPVDAWHIMMSLKSGQLCESGWALNILSGLLGDDSTFSWFCLQSMPGLLETLLDHFRASLIVLFDHKFNDLELDWTDRSTHLNLENMEKRDAFICSVKSSHEDFHFGRDNTRADGSCTNNDKYKRPMKLETLSDEQWLNDRKMWNLKGQGEFESSAFDWQLGRGDCSRHILMNMNSFESEDFLLQKYFGRKIHFLVNRQCYSSNLNSRNKSGPVLLGHSSKHFSDKNDDFYSGDLDKAKCDHMLCQKLQNIFPNNCLRDWFSVASDNWYSIETHGDENFNLFHETFCEHKRRCLQLSNIFRSLSFLPGNDAEMSKHSGLLVVLARLLLLEHEHNTTNESKCVSSEHENWQPFSPKEYEDSHPKTGSDILNDIYNVKATIKFSGSPAKLVETLCEDALAILANISGQLDLSLHANEICSPILNGILHWTTCFSAVANDCNTPTSSVHIEPGSVVPSFVMLALETSSKLCILDSNVDLLMATPPFSRIVLLVHRLSDFLARGAIGDHLEDDSPSWMTDQIAREFSLVILSSLVQADSSCAQLLAINRDFIGTLLSFIEVQCLKMHLSASPTFTHSYNDYSSDMLKRAILILHRVSQIKSKDEVEKRSLLRYRDRLLDLLCYKLPGSNLLSAMVSDVLSFISS